MNPGIVYTALILAGLWTLLVHMFHTDPRHATTCRCGTFPGDGPWITHDRTHTRRACPRHKAAP